MILELKDKIGDVSDEEVAEAHITAVGGDIIDEAIMALVSLGYNQNEIMPVVKKIGKNAQSVEAVIKLALREFSKG